MPIIETDTLVALINKHDPNHEATLQYLERAGRLKLSPYVLLELDLIIRSGRLKLADYARFFEYLGEALAFYNVVLAAVRPDHFSKARHLREKHGLTYFDSLHASVAILENEPLISYDKAYIAVEELESLNPREASKQHSHHR